ncbi:MAG: thiamine-phosphate kinase [Candidatus Omnitrophota bacterium]
MKFNELDWVDFLRKKAGRGKDVLIGIGDDCAQVRVGKEKLLLKSDLFIEGIHFKKNKIDFKTIGMRAVGRVLSDFAACAGVPKFIGVSAGISKSLKPKDLKEILSGIVEYGKKYNFSLVGGDTSKSEKFFLDIWGVGAAKKCLSRNTARKGDYIFLTGSLGEREFNQAFRPRLKEAQFLAKNFKINAMIDISDGFIIDLFRILKMSRKGAVVYKDKVPVKSGISDFYRGEDYELIFTVDKNEKKIEALKKKFYLVGKIESGKFGYKMKKGHYFRLEDIKVKGYTHF